LRPFVRESEPIFDSWVSALELREPRYDALARQLGCNALAFCRWPREQRLDAPQFLNESLFI
jgi:hypothetical protein